MKIGDRVFVVGYVDEIRKDTVIIRNSGGYFGTAPSEVIDSVKPEPRNGEWVSVWDEDGVSSEAVCNICGRISARPAGSFCKWCGADMRGDDDE